MFTKKRRGAVFFIALMIVCFLTGSLFFNTTNTANYVYAINNKDSKGTFTDDVWKGSQTTDNLVYVSDGKPGSDSPTPLVKFGWAVTSEVHLYARHYTDVGLDDPNYGWGIQAAADWKNIGDSSYNGGVWYPITLSEADRVKANKGDLTISASSVNFHQTSAALNVSVKLFFYDEKNSEISQSQKTESRNIFQNESPVFLNLSGIQVPNGTASIHYYVSNRSSLAGKPFIGGLHCTLTDKVAAKAVRADYVENSTIKGRGGAIADDTISYSVTFDERVSVSSPGTATINVAGTTVNHKSYTLTTSGGVSTIKYDFTVPSVAKNGTISFQGVKDCKVKDDAGNSSTINYTDTSSVTTVKYYKKMSVTPRLSHITFNGNSAANFGTNYTATLSPATGYDLPETITVSVGSNILPSSSYDYNKQTGAIKINGSLITDDIEIQANGVPQKSKVNLDMQSGTGGTDNVTATYDASMPSINAPTRKGYTFQGYYKQPGGGGKQYYNERAESVTACDFDTEITLYAYWIANKYTIKFDKNKPGNASNDVQGTTSESSRTYDDGEKALPKNGFTLTGWTFRGWSRSNSGSVDFTNEKTVQNLTDQNNGLVTLYAVWEANTYTVHYDPNKPDRASGEIVGTTSDSSHTYDTAKALTANDFSLTGWTFQGWATSAESDVAHNNAAEVRNLTATDGETVTLYAVWTANKYTIKFDKNKPGIASNEVQGSTSESSRIYDDGMSSLPQNGFTLIGWTFQGWSRSNSGGVNFTNGQSVENLTASNGETVTLYAVWEANSHTIILNAMGGTNAGSLTSTFDKAYPDINIPERYGYNFLGYFDSRSDGTQYYDETGRAINATLTEDNDIFLYAQWEAITYTIRLYSEREYIQDIENVKFGELTLPSAEKYSLSRKNFDFVGWNIYDEQDWAMYRADTLYTTGLTGDQGDIVVLYAAWLEKPIYSLFYDANGGTGAPATIQVHQDETITISEIVPLRDDHTFVGWALYADAKIAVYYPNVEYTMGSSAVTLYAVWKQNPSLSYNANKGTFNYNVATIYPVPKSSVTITTITPVRTGYEFVGWATNENAEDAQYHGGEVYTMPDENIVFYAVWKQQGYSVSKNIADGYNVSGLDDSYSYGDKLKFTVSGTKPKVYINGTLVSLDEDGYYSYDVTGNISVTVADNSSLVLQYSANGGEDAPTDKTFYSKAGQATVSNDVPVRTGYKFCGWSDDKDASSANYTGGESVTFSDEDVVLYAVWQANTYKVTYHAEDCEGSMDESTYSYGKAGTLPINGFTKTGYAFVGWALSDGGECVFEDGDAVLNLTAQDGGEVELHAVWELCKTLITFDTNGGVGGSASFTVKYGETLPENWFMAPVRDGYTFGGYFTQKEGEGQMLFDLNMLPANDAVGAWHRAEQKLTLYAYWIPTPETIEDTIVSVQADLGRATEELQTAIQNNQDDIEAELSALKAAYQAADTTLRSGLAAEDTRLEALIKALEITMNAADNALQITIDAVQAKLDKAIKDFQEAIDKNKADITDLQAEIVTLKAAYKAADDTLRSDLAAEDKRLEALIEALKITMNAADKSLQTAIDAVEAKLDKATKDLQQAIADNKADIESKLASVEAAYKAADLLIGDDIVDLKAKDSELSQSIADLESAYQAADKSLQESIDALQNRLDSAAKDLRQAIEDNKTDIEGKLAALETAYKVVDALLRSDMTEADEALEAKIDALEKTMKDVDSLLQETIDTLQSKLDKATKDLQQAIDDNKTDIEGKLADIESKLADVDAAYKAADLIINGDIAALKEKDSQLSQSISDLETAYKAADDKLQDAIDALGAKLDKAIEELQQAIEANKTDIENNKTDIEGKLADIEDKLAAVESAYKAADLIINDDIAALKEKDSQLSQSISDLETAYKAADDKLQEAIDALGVKLDKAIEELQQAIEANKTDIEANKTDIEAKLAAVESAYKAADLIIGSDIADLKGQDSILAQSISDLETAYKAADDKLQSAIDALGAKLDKAIKDLQQAIKANETNIDGNKADIEGKLADVEAAYEAADLIINGNLAALIEKNSQLSQSITDLETAYKEADGKLQEAIDKLQDKLDKAIKDLQQAISGNKEDIESRVAALETAYNEVDALMGSSIPELKAKDIELAQSIAALDIAYKAADTALWEGIRQVELKYESLEQQNERTALIHMIINIVLGCIAVALIVTLVVKVFKKKNSQQ